MKPKHVDIAILGAGPIGLEAALAAAEAGVSIAVYEVGRDVADHVRSWGHVRLFTAWDLNVSPRMGRFLERSGHDLPPADEYPTGHELVSEVLEPLSRLPEISPHMRLGTRVLSVAREGLLKHEEIASERRGSLPFRLLVQPGDGPERIEHADIVIDCTGTYGVPNALGDGGIAAPGERAAEDRITRTIPNVAGEPESWVGRTTLLVGAGHSAQTVVHALAELASTDDATRVIWALRRDEPHWDIQDDDPLPERSRLARSARDLAAGSSSAIEALHGVVVDALQPRSDRIEVRLRRSGGSIETREVDRIVAMTGYVADDRLYRQLQVHECYASSAPMKLSAVLLAASGGSDCLAQTGLGAETLVNPEPGFFILGSKSYGRNNTFLMRVGWEQVEELFGMLSVREPPPPVSSATVGRA